MSDVTAGAINSNGFSENLVNKVLGMVKPFSYTVNSGSGSATKQDADFYGIGTTKIFSGMHSLKVVNTDFQNTDLVFSNSGDDYTFVTDSPKNHYVSAFFYNTSNAIDTTYTIQIFQDGSDYQTLVFGLNPTTMPDLEQFYRMGQNVFFDSGYIYTFKHTLVHNVLAPTNSKTIYIGGFAIQCLNKGTSEEAPYSAPKDIILQSTTSVDVPSLASGDTYTVSVTVTGAKVGDSVQPIYPPALLTSGLILGSPLVTADDTVEQIVFNPTAGAINPSAADFTYKITR